MDTYLLTVILICIIFSALFSGLEIAFISTNKLHIELRGKQGSLSAKVLSRFARQPSNFIATTLIGNNLTLVIYGIFMAAFLEPWLVELLPAQFNNDILILFLQTILSTIVVLFTAEYIPKSIFLINPYRMLSFLAVPFLILYYFLSPITIVIVLASKIFITGILRLEYSDDKPIFRLTDLNNYLKKIADDSAEHEEQEVDTKFFNNALDFKTVKVRECMIPRTEMVAVDINDPIQELKDQFVESGHSKIIVYDESVDEVIGYCHSLELFKKPTDIKSILTKILIVPETMAANELLVQLITDRKSLALVVDEYGGTSGIVSIEDIIEEIFGEIHDEHDDQGLVEEKINDQEYILSARQEIDYLNDTYGWALPEGDFDTLGGLILAINENLPEEDQCIETDEFSFEILQMEEARIEKIKLKKKSIHG